MSKQLRIIIIGAGVAGIAAAKKLLEHGYVDITILEAEDRVGGRINTVKLEDCNVELGAQWCHGEEGNIVYGMSNDLGILAASVNTYMDMPFYSSSGAVIEREISDRLLEIFYEITFDDDQLLHERGSFGEYFMRRYNEIIQLENPRIRTSRIAHTIMDWFQGMTLCYDGGESWFDISALGLLQYQSCGGNLLLNWKSYGFKTILEILMGTFPKNSRSLPILHKVLFNKEVKKIIWTDPKNVLVKCADGTTYFADHVIVTVSLGVLKENYKTMFVPDLPPRKQLAIENLGIGAANKIFLKFPKQWWPKDTPGFSFVWEQEDKVKIRVEFNLDESSWISNIFGFYVIDNAPGVLMGWSVGRSTRKMEVLSEKQVTRICMYVLKKFLGNIYDIPMPTKVIWSKWGTNPHFRGSYSFRSLDSEKTDISAKELSAPLSTRSDNLPVLFAGEATHSKYYSTVHGALETGYKEARRIIELHKNAMTIRTKVVIIGGGIAGLGAASALLDVDFGDFVLLEATDRVGGRIHTVQHNGNAIELGAQWLHSTDNRLYEIALHNHLVSSKLSRDSMGMYVRDDGFIFNNSLVMKINSIVGQILQACEKFTNSDAYPKSVGEYLVERFRRYASKLNDEDKELALQLLDWHIRFQIVGNSCVNLYDLSAKNWGKYAGLWKNGQMHVNLINGYQTLVNLILRRIPKEKVKLLYPVYNITFGTSEVMVTCQHERKVICEHVILTSPIGFLKENVITFSPRLPEVYHKCIESFGFHGMGKIFLVFKNKWWEVDGFQLIWRKEATLSTKNRWLKCLSGFDKVFNQEFVLVGWIGGEWVDEMERLDEETVGKECVELLRKFLDRTDIPYPEKTIRTTWSTNPWVKGGFSYMTPSTDQLVIEPELFSKALEVNDVPRLYFAGEGCDAEHFSTTHGAFHSGISASQEILQVLGNANRK